MPKQVSRVKELVYGRVDREISLQDMAGAAGLSSGYLVTSIKCSEGRQDWQLTSSF
jgi:hypothetical protein